MSKWFSPKIWTAAVVSLILHGIAAWTLLLTVLTEASMSFRPTAHHDRRQSLGRGEYRFARPRLSLSIISLMIFILSGAAPATAQIQRSDLVEEKVYDFNLDAADLPHELIELSNITGQQLLYDTAITHGLSGAQVRGRYSVTEALLIALANTDLVPHISANGIVITKPGPILVTPAKVTPKPTDIIPGLIALQPLYVDATIHFSEAPDYSAYGLRLANELKLTLSHSNDLRETKYKMIVLIWVDNKTGQIVKAKIPASANSNEVNSAVSRTLNKLFVSAPPAQMPQPIALKLQSDQD